RRFRHDIGIDRCPIKGVGHQLPKVLRQESYVADRFGLPVRRLKDLIEVRKRRIPKRVPKGEQMIPGDREKSQPPPHPQPRQTRQDRQWPCVAPPREERWRLILVYKSPTYILSRCRCRTTTQLQKTRAEPRLRFPIRRP